MATDRKFVINQRRVFGSCLEDAFVFLGINFRPMLRSFLFFAAPLFLIGSLIGVFAYKSFFQGMFNGNPTLMPGANSISGMSFSIGAVYISLALAYFMVYAISFAATSAYHEKDNEKIVFSDISKRVWKYTGKLFVFFLLFGLLMALLIVPFSLIGFLGIIGVFFGFVIFPLIIYLYVRLVMAPYVYVHEKTGFVGALKRSWSLMEHNWWITFALLILLGFVSYQVMLCFYMPSTLLMFLRTFSGITGAEAFWMAFIMITSMFGLLVSSFLTSTTLTMKYYDLVAQKDSSHWDDRISQIGTHTDSTFENEGEF